MVDLKGLKFAKMHGIGNDFPIIDESREEQIPEADKPEACRQLCHRNFGVGGDGVLFVVPSEVADIGYRMFNPDGSFQGQYGKIHIQGSGNSNDCRYRRVCRRRP